MRNIKLLIEYNGKNYFGWQIQSGGKTIQGIIESKLSIITKAEVGVIGSGRTDAGVHALGQVANFKTELRITPDEFKKALNSLLPGDIVIKHAEEVDGSFHSRFDATSRIYEYMILNSNTPSSFLRNYAYMVPRPIDVDLMNEACEFLIGVHDFASYASNSDPVHSTVRNVMDAKCKMLDAGYWMQESGLWLSDVMKEHRLIVFRIRANAFLRGMVRAIVGTLLEVGMGRMPPEKVKEILEMKDRSCAGPSLPAKGLCLVKVGYEN